MSNDLKILVIGSGEYTFYENALHGAFQDLGYKNAKLFKYDQYLKGKMKIEFIDTLIYKFQNKFSFGFGVKKLNQDIIKCCKEDRPELVFLYRCRAVYPRTVKRLKDMGCTVFSYNNDNPFSDYYPKYFWRQYKKSIQFCDINFVYRQCNIKDCKEYGSKKTEILRSYYMKKRNYETAADKRLNDIPEVVFLGHYEKDERKEFLEALAESGVIIGLPSVWKGIIKEDNIVFLKNTGVRYNDILNSTKIALVFLSKLNMDTYTRRCFEIPATKTMMLSVYTDDLSSMFAPDKEAVYFKSKEELVTKVKYYLTHDESRRKIGQAGYERLMNDGHEVQDRAKQIINSYLVLKEQR